jgi:hypothetical protein
MLTLINTTLSPNFVYLYADVMRREIERRGSNQFWSDALFVDVMDVYTMIASY